MDEGIKVAWNVVVDDEGDAVNIDASGGDVGGNDGFDLTFLEGIENPFTLILTQVAVQASDVKAVFFESFNRQVHHALGVAEDDGLVVVLHPNEKATEHPEFVGAADSHRVEVNGWDIQRFCIGEHEVGFVHEFVSSVNDFLRESCGKQEGLLSPRHAFHHPHDVREEPHVQHAVGFVQAEHLRGRQIDVTSLAHVHDSTGSANDDVNALAQSLGLLFKVRTTVDGEDGESSVALQQREFFSHLVRQFTGWCQNQGLK